MRWNVEVSILEFKQSFLTSNVLSSADYETCRHSAVVYVSSFFHSCRNYIRVDHCNDQCLIWWLNSKKYCNIQTMSCSGLMINSLLNLPISIIPTVVLCEYNLPYKLQFILVIVLKRSLFSNYQLQLLYNSFVE